jgi:glutathione synthase/RimK-type ligase-like ATP-grasp enzyme
MSQQLLLIVGGESDPNTQRIVDQAHLRGIRYFFWNTDNQGANQIAWDFQSPRLDLGDTTIHPTAVYLRYNVFEADPPTPDSPDCDTLTTEALRQQSIAAFEMIQSYVLAWPQIKILNRKSMTDANNKCHNLRLAIELGFQIPQTMVMGDLTPLARMPSPETHAMKPLGGGAHTVSVGDVYQDIEKLAQLGPMFVQEKLAGENLRVFSIGGTPFCFHLQTQSLDYRDDAMVSVVQVDVPEILKEPTKAMAERIGFDYCALDFRCRQGMHEPVFLEINSFPMFVRFDDAGQNCLADTVLDFLCH